MSRPQAARRRSISTKVVLSFVAVVLFQGIVSIVAVTWILSRTASGTLDEQLARTGYLVDKYFYEQSRSLQVKAKLLAGQEKIIGLIHAADYGGIRQELEIMLDPLRLDAAFIVTPSLSLLASGGNQETLAIARSNGITLAPEDGTGIILTGRGSKMQMWALCPIFRQQLRVGTLYASINLDRTFLAGMEEACNARLLLSLRRSIMVNGHLSDPVFLEYTRRSYADPGHAESGQIENLVYRLARFANFKDLSAVFFLDTSAARSLMLQYTVFSVLFLILVLVLGVVMAVGLYRLSFQRPFASFQAAIRAISRGELSFRAKDRGGDEFSELEREFETMTVNLKRLEERLQITSRMAAVGEMVAGVAHQVRNPLAIMKVSAGILGEAFSQANDPDGKYRKLVDMIAGEVDTLSDVITNFLDFTRPLQVHREAVDVAAFLAHAVEVLPVERFTGVSVLTDCPPGLPNWSFDRGLIHQVLANLLVNACEAAPPGSAVRLTASLRQPENRLVVEVADQGPGMEEAVAAQVFNPFFTTKSSGNGLGLSIAHRIVESHGGAIELDTAPGAGTRFRVVL